MKSLNNYISERLNPRNLGSDTLPRELKEKYKLIYNPGTGRYDCDRNVDVEDDLIENGHFICNFGIIKGFFDCSGCDDLTSLQGAPREVDGYFDCSECNDLESLEGAPKKIDGCFYCDSCKNLASIEGAPREVGGDFNCSNCENLVSLKGAPIEVGRDFSCINCFRLKDYNINTKIGGIFEK